MESLDNATDDENFREERSILEIIQVEIIQVLHIFSEARTRRKDLNSIRKGALCWVRNSYGKQN